MGASDRPDRCGNFSLVNHMKGREQMSEWKQMPGEFFQGVSHVLVIYGENCVSWITTRKMKETAMSAWKEDKRTAERDGGSYDAWPPLNLRAAVRYLSDNRPGLKIARELNETIVVKRETAEQREQRMKEPLGTARGEL